jgi:hypothetical protein
MPEIKYIELKRKATEDIADAREDLELAKLELEHRILRNSAKKIRQYDCDRVRKCIICLDYSEQNYVLIPCGHRVYCDSCINKIVDCPLCKRSISNRLKIYE